MKKIRVLHILDELNTGGAERIVVSYYQHINRDRFQWDFIITRYADQEKRGLLEDTVEELGGKIYRVTRKRENYIRNITETAEIIKKGNYDIVHSHLDELSAFYLLSAKKAGVPVRICHSHLVGADRGKSVELICKMIYPLMVRCTTDRFACGTEAGKALWGSEAVNNGMVHIMKNAIETDRFRFIQRTREETRQKLGLTDHFVAGSVGRLSYQKNSLFLIHIIQQLIKIQPDAILLVVGEGDQKNAMQEQAATLSVQDHVIFAGVRTDINELMMAMDVFLLPSRFEGLPIVLVEAQCTGLPCIVSDQVTQEVKMNENVKYLPIHDTASMWALECTVIQQPVSSRENAINAVMDAGYGITEAAKDLEQYYIAALDRERP